MGGSQVTGNTCSYCGANPAAGYASIQKDGERKWYCHNDESTTCYEYAQIGLALENSNTWKAVIKDGKITDLGVLSE